MKLPIRALAVIAAVAVLAAIPGLRGTAAADLGSAVKLGQVPLSPGLARDLATLPADTPYGVFVHFRGGAPAEWQAHLEDHGMQVVDHFEAVEVSFGIGTLGDVRALTHSREVSYLESNDPIVFHMETAAWATRVRVAQEPVSGGPYRDSVGRVVDGTGVGVAVIDSGADRAHPDLAGRIVKDFKVECSLILEFTANGRCFPDPIETPPGVGSDTTSGHGTHVAGIVAGDGTASAGTYRGVAPGASLFTFGVGEGINIFFAAEAYEYLVDEYATFSPRIRVINNSWGGLAGAPYDPNSIISKLVGEATALGITSVFAAGNDGDDADTGSADDMSATAKDPTPGVISVANYDDAGTGSRDNTLDASSSRGKRGLPANYPDISAPGASISSTCNPRLAFCALGASAAWSPHYAFLSGTSMAAPHVSGAAALLYQARPELRPAQVEDLIQDTARKFAGGTGAPGPYEPDPQNAASTIAYDKGAGLLDVVAALTAMGIAHDGKVVPPKPELNITSPADGAVVGGSVTVFGTAFDGTPPPAERTSLMVADGDLGDYAGPAAADLVSLFVAEGENAMTYTIGLANASDLGLTNVSLRVTQVVNGTSFLTTVNVTRTGVTIPAASSSNNAPASAASVDRAQNTVSITVPFSNLGNPPSGVPAYNVFASSFIAAIQDVMPGGPGADVIIRPRFAKPYTIVRPQTVVPPVASVGLVLDGGDAQPAVLTGSSPTYEFIGQVDVSALADGTHTIAAVLHLDGAPVATDTVSMVVEGPIIYSIEITSPLNGDTVLLQPTEVRGTASPSRPSLAVQEVTVRVAGNGFDSGALPATGVENWVRTFDFGVLAPGTYEIAATYLVDGAPASIATIGVVVPAPAPGDEVSYNPQGLGWWRAQYAGTHKTAQLLPEEAQRLADRAVQLSAGYFANGDALRSALFASGHLTSQARAARQYAVLLVNLAGGDLSRAMTVQVGLSGGEQLSPSAYDVERLGSTVDSAAGWIRSQFPDGDLGSANEVASSINGGVGLQ